MKETMEYGTVRKAELIREVVSSLENADQLNFAKDVSRFLHTKIEPTDDYEVFEYWHRAIGLPDLFWREVNDNVFEIRFKSIEAVDKRLEVYVYSDTIDLATFNNKDMEKCINRRGYTLDGKNTDYQSIHGEYGEDAYAMIAIFLSGKDDPDTCYLPNKLNPIKHANVR